ncbi:Fe-S cluster assembly protein SufB, partial [Pauljensenia sp. UMB0018B]|nr:Fe-S cluster assembly protein SufB [Pauljensenia sp. UMB0018B]
MTTSPPVGSSAAKEAADEAIINSIGAYEYGWHDSDAAGSVAKRGLNADVVRYISKAKNEPEWMLKR